MNYTINEVINYLEKIAPCSYQENYDNAGLLVGNRKAVLQKGLICLDVTPSVFREAIETKSNLIISHHPFIFHPLKKITGESLCENLLIQAIKNDIAIYAIHTNFDNVLQGVNGRFADKLHLINRKILKPTLDNLCKFVTFVPTQYADAVRNALFEAGAGSIGNYDACSYNNEGYGTFRANRKAHPFVGKVDEIHREPEERIEVIVPAHRQKHLIEALHNSHPYEESAYDIFALENGNPYVGAGLIGEIEIAMNAMEFLQWLKKQMQIPCVKFSNPNPNPLKKVAICGGSGSFLIAEAMKQQADVFVSSELKHNHFVEAEGRMLLVDIGHYESEIQTKHLLYDILIEKFSNFAVSEKEQNPILYLY
jgi:dinuclear metal center YbgI/SA1388 family protein